MDYKFVEMQIEEHQEEIDELNKELENVTSSYAKSAIQNRLIYLSDNQYRYILQARRMGLTKY